MDNALFFKKLETLLDTFAKQKKQVKFWWRDDDTIENTPALDQLMALAKKHAVPLYLAVIPNQVKDSLKFPDHQEIYLLQHGFRHHSRALQDQKKCEFPAHIDSATVAKEVAQGFSHLQNLFGHRFEKVFVPPWNRFAENHIDQLKKVGLHSLSLYGPAQNSYFVNTHFDIIEWRAGRSFIGYQRAFELLKNLLEERMESNEPIGLLTHHLVHDQALWQFNHDFLTFVCGHPACQFLDRDQLFPNRLTKLS